MSDFHRIKTVSDVHRFCGMQSPMHTLITVIRKWPEVDSDYTDLKIVSDLYMISMKGKTTAKTFQYGKNSYDFEEGTLVFMSPNQVLSFSDPVNEVSDSGWTILFHPDLIRKSELGKTISQYSFFKYEINEALHLSDKEKKSLNDLVEKIETELNQNIDKHSQDIIIQNIESILKYSNRYYDRQFYTRANLNKDFVTKFEKYLNDYFSSLEITEKGIPSLQQCGEALNMSGPYLSDLLKIETGSSAKDHIHAYIIEKAKTSLLNSTAPISDIAFSLGFEYPQHFSKLFKSKVGLSPSEYRSFN
jgi:AraC-like DNA-binding protein